MPVTCMLPHQPNLRESPWGGRPYPEPGHCAAIPFYGLYQVTFLRSVSPRPRLPKNTGKPWGPPPPPSPHHPHRPQEDIGKCKGAPGAPRGFGGALRKNPSVLYDSRRRVEDRTVRCVVSPTGRTNRRFGGFAARFAFPPICRKVFVRSICNMSASAACREITTGISRTKGAPCQRGG